MNGNIPVGFLFFISFEDASAITKFKGVPVNKGHMLKFTSNEGFFLGIF